MSHGQLSNGQVCVIAGGVGAARLLRGLQDVVSPTRLTAVVNVGDDDIILGLAISPDLDTVLYTCTEAIDPIRGWGLADEHWRAIEAVRAIESANGRDDLAWFGLGDRDLGTHLWRTARRNEGATLSEVTAELSRARGLAFRLLPASDDPISTRLTTVRGEDLAFQEYFVRQHHDVAVTDVRFVGSDVARAAPGVIDAITAADLVIIAPSNPIVSIGPIRAVVEIDQALRAARHKTVAISPIVGGVALKGPADRMLRELGHSATVTGVAGLLTDVAATLVIDEVDAHLVQSVEQAGLRAAVTSTVMIDRAAAADLGRFCLTIGALQ